jgi:hypothetical protein
MIDGSEKENMINKFKMKNILIIPIILLGSIFVNAQDCITSTSDNYGGDSINCRKNLSLYTGYLSQKKLSRCSSILDKDSIKMSSIKTELIC